MLKYEKAIVFATKAHQGQQRKGDNTPYIIHPLIVGMTLQDRGCIEDIVTAGILHDTVEDTWVTLKDIEKNFGKNVSRIVKGVSEPDKSLPWRQRKEHTIEYIKKAPLDERLLICADKLHNLSSMTEQYQQFGESLWDIFNGGKEEQLWYYRSVINSLTERQDMPTAKNLLPDLIVVFEKFVKLIS